MDKLPLKRDLTLAYAFSLVVLALLVAVSAAGLLVGGMYGGLKPVHPVVSRGGDVANLVVGLPILLGSIWLSRRGHLIGLLFWPVALFFVAYTYSLYAVGAPLNALFIPYVLLVALSGYTLIGIVASIDGDGVRGRLKAVPARLVGGVLIALSAAAVAGLTVQVITELSGPASGAATLRGQGTIAVDHIVGSVPLMIGGVLLWQRRSLGYAATGGLLLVSAAGGIAFAISAVMEGLLAGSMIDVGVIAIHLAIAIIYLALLAVLVRATTGRQPSELIELKIVAGASLLHQGGRE
jgi:hypothetical protein